MPSEPTPTDPMEAIRARHARDERLTRWVRPDEMHADRAALLAEVERLTEQLRLTVIDAATAEAEANDVRTERDALAARPRGCATVTIPDAVTRCGNCGHERDAHDADGRCFLCLHGCIDHAPHRARLRGGRHGADPGPDEGRCHADGSGDGAPPCPEPRL